MTFQEFKNTLHQTESDSLWSPHLRSLWHDGKGDWETSHNIIQDINGSDAAWIHAYLHRKEGDNWNANYWYRRANRKMPKVSLEEEWADLVRHFLK